MPDPSEMSVEEILAACRAEVSGGGDESAPPAEAVVDSAAEPAPAAPASSAPAASGKNPQEMSIEEMMAAARGEKAASAPSEADAEPAVEESAAPAASKKNPAEMSMEEMLAAARGEKAAPKAKPAAAKKPAATAAKKASPPPKAAAAAQKTGPKETASVLTGSARPKAGPMSKAQAAAKDEVPAAPKGKTKLAVPPMPEKPAYAIPASPPPASDDSRRGFFAAMGAVFLGSSLAVGFTSLAITHLLWLLGLARFMFPNILTEPPTRFKVGFPDDYAPGQVQTKFKAQFGVWIVRYNYEGQPQIFAIKSVCTHLGCTPNWLEGEQKFKCPCHGSGFYKDGINFEGPAPRPLERYAIKISDDGQIEVDKSRKFQEELGQWQDAACFVPV